MINKIKDNLALIVTAITLMGSIGAGVQSLGAVLNTLTGIDDRMNIIESEFTQLKESTMVSNDIAVLYEKISALEAVARDADMYENQIAYLTAELNNLDQKVRDLEFKVDEHINFDNNFQDSQEYSLQKWEWQDMQKKITTLENNQLESWELDNLRDRITY
jgi:predicted  nucleic acid-binding Zn-ribbon protein